MDDIRPPTTLRLIAFGPFSSVGRHPIGAQAARFMQVAMALIWTRASAAAVHH
jgi:hypothetical protein